MPDAPNLPPALAFYRVLTRSGAPLLPLITRWRFYRGQEERHRTGERFAKALPPRPDGRLIWFHGVSMGESLSALPLIEELKAREPTLTVLMTTGTVTSARLMAHRLPAGDYHQYAPYDHTAIINRFLDHWRPDLAIWIESELWPNLILQTHARRIPMALVNARLSETSFRRWSRAPDSIARLLACFSLCMAQNETIAGRLRQLGAPRVETPGNLKWDAPPLAADPAHLATLKKASGTRPVWIAASTHDGEEDIAAKAHLALARQYPALLTIIIPRHPVRGDAVARIMKHHGLRAMRRSEGRVPDAGHAVYIADTTGEMGLFYRLSSLVFMGGTLTPHGGQNPMEAARLGCCILHGPHGFNFADAFRLLDDTGGGVRITGLDGLTAALARRLGCKAQTVAEGERAKETVQGFASITDDVACALMALMPSPSKTTAS